MEVRSTDLLRVPGRRGEITRNICQTRLGGAGRACYHGRDLSPNENRGESEKYKSESVTFMHAQEYRL